MSNAPGPHAGAGVRGGLGGATAGGDFGGRGGATVGGVGDFSIPPVLFLRRRCLLSSSSGVPNREKAETSAGMELMEWRVLGLATECEAVGWRGGREACTLVLL